MSGTTVATQTGFPFPVTLDRPPKEGPKAVSTVIKWDYVGNTNLPVLSASVNLLSQFNSGQFTTIQAVWVDNSTVPFPVQISCAQEPQSVTVPAFSQGVYPLIVGLAPQFTVSQLRSPIGGFQGFVGGTTTLAFLNVPVPSYTQAVQPAMSWTSVTTGGALSVQVLPAPGAGTRYILYGFTVWVTITGQYGGVSQAALAQLTDGTTPFYQDYYWAGNAAGPGNLYQRTVTFAAPILFPGTGPISFVTGLSVATNLFTAVNLQYGVATIT